MQVLDKEFELFMRESELQQVVKEFAQKLDEAYSNKDLIIVAILNGSFIFVSDLIRYMKIDPEIVFMKYRSYEGIKSGEIQAELELDQDIEDRHVLILEDIVDTGKTIIRIAQDLQEHEPASLNYGTLFVKPDTYNSEVKLKFVGKELPSDFVIGYGMDYCGKGRGLRELYRLKG